MDEDTYNSWLILFRILGLRLDNEFHYTIVIEWKGKYIRPTAEEKSNKHQNCDVRRAIYKIHTTVMVATFTD